MKLLTIGQFAKKAEVNVDTIRYYERRRSSIVMAQQHLVGYSRLLLTVSVLAAHLRPDSLTTSPSWCYWTARDWGIVQTLRQA
jgi:hypothetical protein